MDSEALIVGIVVGGLLATVLFLAICKREKTSLNPGGSEGILIDRNPAGDITAVLPLRANTIIDRGDSGEVKSMVPLFV